MTTYMWIWQPSYRRVVVCDLSSPHLLQDLQNRAAELKHGEKHMSTRSTVLIRVFYAHRTGPAFWMAWNQSPADIWVDSEVGLTRAISIWHASDPPPRKLVRRLTTPDLMFGQMVAPPPASSGKSCVDADDVLQCFHETGSPATSELSPITVGSYWLLLWHISTGIMAFFSVEWYIRGDEDA